MTATIVSPFDAVPFMARKHALFLDFDGTLAPLQDDPDAVALPRDGAATLLSLHHALSGALVLISGRDIRDLSQRTPVDLWRAGGHGLEICKPGEQPSATRETVPTGVMASVEAITGPLEGVRIEDKGPVLAVHFRQNPSAEQELLSALTVVANETDGYKAQHGKMVIELKPLRANKGAALAAMMQDPPFAGRIPIMVGDDTTDEDAMRAATDAGGYGIKVGAGETCAEYRLADTKAVWEWLRRVVNEHA
ncbi:MAG: trehalose-phosphatase [Henriciella sp.]